MNKLLTSTGIASISLGQIIMMAVSLALIWLAVRKRFEPLLLLPIGFGGLLANVPLVDIAGDGGLLGILYGAGIETGLFPLLVFLGVGAMTDFSPLIANPKMTLLGAAAQFGIFITFIGSLFLAEYCGFDFDLRDAASIGIIGGADGPTAIFLTSRLSPDLLGAVAIAAYSYMALIPIIQPPIMRLLTTEKERRIVMQQLRPVSRVERVLFPLVVFGLCVLFLPTATPLIGMLMFGNLLRESRVVERLSRTAQNELVNIVTILLGLVAFSGGTASGMPLARLMNRVSRDAVNPLIGAAGVSAVPMAARVVNQVGLEADPENYLLMHAMGPNVSGVIGSAVAAGVLLAILG